MEKAYRNFQSYSMPLKRNLKSGGSNADVSKSTMFCSLFYKKDALTQPTTTTPDIQIFVKGKLKKRASQDLLLDSLLLEFQKWRDGKIVN